MNHASPGFGGVLPLLVTGNQPAAEPHRDADAVPARVRVAADYLKALTWKTQAFPAANDVAIEVVPGQRLTADEEAAQTAAANLLEHYFKGDLPASEPEALALRQAADPDKRAMGTLIHCMNCNGHRGNSGCKLCRGCGGLLVYPSDDKPRGE